MMTVDLLKTFYRDDKKITGLYKELYKTLETKVIFSMSTYLNFWYPYFHEFHFQFLIEGSRCGCEG